MLQNSELGEVLEAIALKELEIKQLEEQVSTLKQFFKDYPDQYPVGTNLRQGPYQLKITSNTRLDDGKAQRELDPDLYARVSKVTLDTTKARKILTEEELTKISNVYDNKISVQVV